MAASPRVVFLGTDSFAVPTLEALAAAGLPPVAVYTQPDRPAGRGRAPRASPVKERASRLGLPVLQPRTLRTPEALVELRGLRPTVLVLAAYGLLLPAAFLAIPPRGGLNVHPSLLPRHRGPAPVAWTILEGDSQAGVTVFLMDEGMDTGPNLAQRRAAVEERETAGALTARLAREGAALLVETLTPWLAGEVTPTPQDESLATYSRLLRKEDGELDLGRPAARLERQVRAYQPWPGTFTRWRGQRLNVLQAAALPSLGAGRPGEVLSLFEAGGAAVGIVTGEGVLRLQVVQLEGRRALSAEEFVRGRRDFLGSVLPS